MKLKNSRTPVLWVTCLTLLSVCVGLPFLTGESEADNALVVYCAHDSLFSEEILRQFEEQTGIRVSIRFDTEATKSLGLVNLLIAEKDHPRCDVFWNNQVLGTLELKEQGVLQPYRGPGYARIPDKFKDPQGCWVGFAARLRVWIVNTDRMSATPAALAEAQDGDLSRMAMAKPLYGTTLSHYSLLWQLWGGARVRQWHEDLRRRGLREAAGNAAVKNLVAAGVCDFGWTDTDDFYVAADAGGPVEMLPIRLDDGRTICIPNSVALIAGSKRRQQAERLIDFLLSEETELALARSPARQIPLGSLSTDELPAEIDTLREWSEDAYDMTLLGPDRKACLTWLKSEYLQ